MSYGVLSGNGVKITSAMDEWWVLADKYNLSYEEVALIDFNRTGICLDDDEVRVGFRTRFNGSILYPNDLSWYALPVRGYEDSNFHAANGKVFFGESLIGVLDKPVLDTCDTSYQRGKRLLNLNSRSRSNCAGCKACVHNDKSLYDDTVIRDKHELITRSDIEHFFQNKERLGVKISELDQIAVVTGLFTNEEQALRHMQDVYAAARQYGFSGELMYFGCQIMSPAAIEEFSKLGHSAIVFAVDNFTRRNEKLSKVKSALALDDLFAAMERSKADGIETTLAYIVGVDDLAAVRENFEKFLSVCTRFPVINIFQIQTGLQAQALHEEARNLEYYVKARIEIEKIFQPTAMRPRRWENYRPLWYREFGGEALEVKAYG